jgi:tetratricopeptide (TPR) repeat protein
MPVWLQCLFDCLRTCSRGAWSVCRWVFKNAADLIAFLSLAAVVAILVYLFSLTKQVVIEDFQVPEDLKKQGYSGAVIGNRIRDGIRKIVADAGEKGEDRFAGDAAPKDSVKVLDTEVPVTFMVELIRSIFRLPVSRIGGDIVQVGPSGGPAVYVTTLRIESEFCSPRTCIFPITSTDIEKGLTEVPFDAMEKIDPYNLAVYYLRVRRTSDAEKLIGDFMREKDISEADRYNVQGGILRQLGKIEEAKGAYGVAKAKDPSDPTPYFNLAELLRDQGRINDALNEYREAVKHQKPGVDDALSADLYAGLGSGYRDLALVDGDQEKRNKVRQEAVQDFKKSISLDPKNPRPYTGLGNLILNEREYRQALPFFEKAHELDPDSAQASFGLAECLRALGDPKASAELYAKIITLSADRGNADGKFEKLARDRLAEMAASKK